MSPARSKRQVVPHRRGRAEIVKAVGVGVGIVAVTALLVWLMRPGPAGIPATGGLMNRQPRASWLVGSGVVVAAIATWFVLRGSRQTRSPRQGLAPDRARCCGRRHGRRRIRVAGRAPASRRCATARTQDHQDGRPNHDHDDRRSHLHDDHVDVDLGRVDDHRRCHDDTHDRDVRHQHTDHTDIHDRAPVTGNEHRARPLRRGASVSARRFPTSAPSTRSTPAGRCSWPRPPAPARPSSPSRRYRARSKLARRPSTRRRSKRCRIRSTATSCASTARRRSDCSPATTRQQRSADRRDDDRSASQHDLRASPTFEGCVRRAGRSPLSPRSCPRRRVGRGDHPSSTESRSSASRRRFRTPRRSPHGCRPFAARPTPSSRSGGRSNSSPIHGRRARRRTSSSAADLRRGQRRAPTESGRRSPRRAGARPEARHGPAAAVQAPAHGGVERLADERMLPAIVFVFSPSRL